MKYKILEDQVLERYGRKLHRIQALKDFSNVKVGDIGGWIESESNLSQKGGCWVYNEALVYGDARVLEKAKVFDEAQVYGGARVSEEAKVFGEAQVYGEARIFGEARVFGEALVSREARIFGEARVFRKACVSGEVQVSGKAWVFGDFKIRLGYFNQGNIERQPLVIAGSKYDINLSGEDLRIGCEIHPLAWWLENWGELDRNYRFTCDQVEEYKEYVNILYKREIFSDLT